MHSQPHPSDLSHFLARGNYSVSTNMCFKLLENNIKTPLFSLPPLSILSHFLARGKLICLN